MKELYHIDIEAEGQHNKLLSELPPVDVVITMGAGDIFRAGEALLK